MIDKLHNVMDRLFNNFAIALFSHPFLIFVLKISTVGSSFISSLRFFDNMLPLNERDSMPKFIVFVIGNKIYSKCVRFTQIDACRQFAQISTKLKLCLLHVIAFAEATYGCEPWTFTETDGKMIDAFEMWCYRTLLRVS